MDTDTSRLLVKTEKYFTLKGFEKNLNRKSIGFSSMFMSFTFSFSKFIIKQIFRQHKIIMLCGAYLKTKQNVKLL